MKYYEENSAAMSEDENLDVESDVSAIFYVKEFFSDHFYFFLCVVSHTRICQ